MATIRAFHILGLKLWYWSNDHEPPHFHAKRSGEWEVKVHFLFEPGEIEWAEKTPSSKQLKELTSLAEEHRAELLAQWEEIQGN